MTILLISQLLGRKTEWEIDRIRKAALEAEEILRWALTSTPIVPDQTTELELAETITEEVERRGHGFAWEPPFCPSVQFEIMPPNDRLALQSHFGEKPQAPAKRRRGRK